MATDENSLLKELRDAFLAEQPLGTWEKLHGDMYSSGLPDALATAAQRAALVEFKWARGQAECELPLRELARKLLTPLQLAKIGGLAAVDGPLRARMLIGGPVVCDALPNGGVVAVGFDLGRAEFAKRWSMVDLAGAALGALGTGKWPGDFPADAQVQLRPHRSDVKWQATRLVLGQWCYGPTKFEGTK